ncbi:tripartite motif-containing protein 2-like [Lingula anatina]|uniref:Tripartite motif-containing protein 2-like n=1 Tax=Lingula anatina TaxID=7574 RepID=A0A1S3JIF9_LINAN|nr:tripartite motif-containing protein 2-like [Lingula anatina]|eukprot:XP_013410153.1 tripartite motif-containing protein 2-like [Lingula anatina]
MAEALATAITDNFLTCSICLGEYEDPRLLSCCHTFCYGCICDYASQTRGRIFQCPLCREVINKDGLVKLKKDFRVHKTKELLSQRPQHEASSPSKETDVHGVTQAIAQTDIGSEVSYYCEDDDDNGYGDRGASNHGNSLAEIVTQSNRQKIRAVLVQTEKIMNSFQKAIAKVTDNKTEDCQIRTSIITEIEQQYKRIIRLIKKRKMVLMSEVNSAYDDKIQRQEAKKDILEHDHASLHSVCKFSQELLTNGTDSDIMAHFESLIEVLGKITFPTPETPVEISYSPGKISAAGLEAMLGNVTVQSQRPVTEQATSVTVVGSQYPPVTEQATAVKVVGSQYPPVTEQATSVTVVGSQYPPVTEQATAVTVVGSQYPPVTEQATAVSVAQSQYPSFRRTTSSVYPILPTFLGTAGCVHSFSPKLKHDSVIKISGLAIDEEQVFVVDNGIGRTRIFSHTGEFKFEIKLKNPEDVALSQTGGLYITSQGYKCVKVYSTRGYITVNSVNDNIVISDFGNDCVHVLSPTGDHLYQYGTQGSGDGQLNGPCGVCTDSFGYIFIADTWNHRIVALNPQGQFIRYIATKKDGLWCPTALAINPAAQLVVAEKWGKVKTFQYLQ